jgi:alpha-aminoadipic semialdehyde synthase
MPLLRELIAWLCTLIDYEQIIDRHGRRLIFFGLHAGYAVMIDALWAFGRRVEAEGIETAFASVEPALAYHSVDEAAEHLTSVVARRIREHGVRPEIHPFVVGFTGGGTVSQGRRRSSTGCRSPRSSPTTCPS